MHKNIHALSSNQDVPHIRRGSSLSLGVGPIHRWSAWALKYGSPGINSLVYTLEQLLSVSNGQEQHWNLSFQALSAGVPS